MTLRSDSEMSKGAADLIRKWSEAHRGPNAEDVLLQMLPVGDQMSLALSDAIREMYARELHHFEEEQKSAHALATIDRIDTALRGDGRSAMLIVVAQEIINQYREGQDDGTT